MAKARPTAHKRATEAAKIEKRQAKEERRAQRLIDRADRTPALDDIDPDIAGIRPGPQPVEEDPLERE